MSEHLDHVRVEDADLATHPARELRERDGVLVLGLAVPGLPRPELPRAVGARAVLLDRELAGPGAAVVGTVRVDVLDEVRAGLAVAVVLELARALVERDEPARTHAGRAGVGCAERAAICEKD